MCRVLGVSTSGYYDWLRRINSAPVGRAARDLALLEEIQAIHEKFRFYGSPRVHRELLNRDLKAGRHHVARLMRVNGIKAQRGKIKVRPRSAPPKRRPEVGDLVKRRFVGPAPNTIWFTDLTLIRTSQGMLHVAVILDSHNREVISWAVANHETPETVMKALADAIQVRRPPVGCIIHSDRGYQFTSAGWLTFARINGLRASIGERKKPQDNAMMESWFASLKNEDIYPGGQPATLVEARMRLFRYVHLYNTSRMHSALSYQSPIEYAKLNQ